MPYTNSCFVCLIYVHIPGYMYLYLEYFQSKCTIIQLSISHLLLSNLSFLISVVYKATFYERFQVRAPTFYQRCRDQQWYINQLQTVHNQYISQINESKQRLAAEISRNAVAATLGIGMSGSPTDPNMMTSKSLHSLPTVSSPTPGMGDNYAIASTSQSTPKRGPPRNHKIFSTLNKPLNSSISSGR